MSAAWDMVGEWNARPTKKARRAALDALDLNRLVERQTPRGKRLIPAWRVKGTPEHAAWLAKGRRVREMMAPREGEPGVSVCPCGTPFFSAPPPKRRSRKAPPVAFCQLDACHAKWRCARCGSVLDDAAKADARRRGLEAVPCPRPDCADVAWAIASRVTYCAGYEGNGCTAVAGKKASWPTRIRRRHGQPWRCLSCSIRTMIAAMTPEQRRERARKANSALTPEHRREGARKVNAAKTPEQCREAARKAHAAMTPEQRREKARKANAAMTPEQRREKARKREAAMTPEQRSEKIRKGWETRRAKPSEVKP